MPVSFFVKFKIVRLRDAFYPKKGFFFLKMAPRPSFWKSTQFSSAGTCIEKVHLNAKPQNFFWNKNQSLVILQIYICFAFKESSKEVLCFDASTKTFSLIECNLFKGGLCLEPFVLFSVLCLYRRIWISLPLIGTF